MKLILFFLGFALLMAKGLAGDAKHNRIPAQSKHENGKLLDEYLIIKNHIGPKESKAKVYIFNRDINKKNYAKEKLAAEYYDLY